MALSVCCHTVVVGCACVETIVLGGSHAVPGTLWTLHSTISTEFYFFRKPEWRKSPSLVPIHAVLTSI